MQRKRSKPTFYFEKPLWRQGYFVVGVDEVGKGAVAGPVVASAVALAPPIYNFKFQISNWERLGIDDSKRLTAKKREKLAKAIKKRALAYGIGEADAGTINRIGIRKATARAMRRALENVQCRMHSLQLNCHSEPKARNLGRPERPHNNSRFARSLTSFGMTEKRYFILVDGYPVKYLPGGLKRQKAIVHGDQKSISIAAASILAKVYRDGEMRFLGRKYPQYYFGKHKGYGTKKHRESLTKFGITLYHRKIFVTTFLRSS